MPRKMSAENLKGSIELKQEDKSMSFAKAVAKSGTHAVYLRKVAYSGEINYGHFKDEIGMRIIEDEKWAAFIKKRGFLKQAREIKPADYSNCGRKKKV